MVYRKYSAFLFALAFLSQSGLATHTRVSGEVLGYSSENSVHEVEKNVTSVKTQTAFDQTTLLEYEPIPFETEYSDDAEMEYGEEVVLQAGVDGTRELNYLITHWQGEQIDKSLVATSVTAPTTEKISKGTKIVWKMYSTPDVGRVKYWYKMRVFATKYDANCLGCIGRTYSGTEVKKGVCATDPKVIPLGTNFYVDGYGLCRAEDIGGLIKGKRIDLGFVDAAKGDWGAAYTDIYLLTNAPY